MSFSVSEYARQRKLNNINNGDSNNSGGFNVQEYVKQRNLPKVGEYLTTSINAWLKKNEAFYGSYNDRIGKYQDKDPLDWAYEADSADWLNSITSTKGELDAGAEDILSVIKEYGQYLDEDYVKAVKSAIDGNRGQYSNILSYATQMNDYWSEFETEDKYKEYVAGQKEYNGMLNYDLVEGQKTIDTTQIMVDDWNDAVNNKPRVEARIYDIEQELEYWETDPVKRAAYEKELASLKQDLARYDSILGSYDGWALEKDLAEKKVFHTNATRVQKAAELASVADVDSENYDPEFEKYAALGNEKGLDTTFALIGKSPVGMTFGSNVNNELIAYRSARSSDGIPLASWAGAATGVDSTDDRAEKFARYMTDKEYKTYTYYYGKYGEEKADEYLLSIEETVNAREAGMYFDIMEGNIALEYTFGVAAGFDQFSSGIEGIFADGYTPTSSMQIASGMAREDLADDGFEIFGSSVGQLGYDFLNSGANMLPSILAGTAVGLINPVAGQVVGATLLGASAGGNAKVEMLNLGYSEEQANTYGIMVAVAEAGMEFALGSIPGISNGGVFSTLGAKAATKIDNAIARVAIKLGNKGTSILRMAVNGAIKVAGGALDEALEEGLQTIIEPWLKEIATGVDWDDANIDEILYSSLLGALTSVALGGIGDVAGEVNTYEAGRTVQKVNGGVSKLQEIATNENFFSADTVAYKIASKVNEQTDAYTIGKLLMEVGGTISEQNYTDIVNGLVERGMRKSDAKKIAKQYQAFLNKEVTLSDEAAKIFEALSPLADTLRNDIIGANTTVYQRTKAYSDLMGLAKEVTNKKKSNKTASASEPSAQLTENASMTENATAKENATESEFEASADGKTIVKETGKAVNVEEIVSNEGGNLMVKLDSGETVNAKDLAYATAEEGLIYEMVANMGVNPQTAMALVKAYNPASGVKAQTYAIDIPLAYQYGKVGNKSGLDKLNLTPEQRYTAYVLGKSDAQVETDKASASLKESLTQAAENAETTASGKQQVRKGKVRFEYGAKAKGKAQRHVVALAKVLSDAIGIDFYFYDSTIDGTPESQSNGYFNPKDNSIHLDLQNSFTDAKTIAYSMSHELVHFIKKWSPAKFKVFADFLMEQYGEHGVDTDTMLRNMMNKLGTDDINEAYEEMVCEACEKMLLDSNATVKLAQLRAKDAGLFEKIKAHVLGILNKIRAEYKKYSPSSDEAQALDKMGDTMEKFYSLFEDMAVDAAQTYQEAVSLNAESVSMSEDGTIKMQMKQYEQTGRTTLYNYLREQYGESDAQNLISTIDNIYDVLKEIKKDEALSVFSNWQDTEIELDEEGHPIFTTSINNGDYELNQDFSRVCKKRRQLDFVLNMLAEDPDFEASNLTKQDFVKINKAIKAHGFEIACALCFVDSKRFRQSEWADSFANTWNDILNSIVTDSSKLTPFNFATKNPNIADDGIEIDTSKSVTYRKWSDGKEDVKNRRTYDSFDQILSKDGDKWIEGNTNVRTIATLLRDHPELRHTFRGADIIASQGFDTIQRLAPGIRSILDGWGGSSVPKPSSNDASYDSSIINSKGYNKETAYAMGGVRMNSFSDFMAHMFFDYCQAFADLSAKELPSQAYTKELTYVRFFGRSGQKINMSGIAAIRDNALPTTASKGVSKAEAEANEKIEKMVAGLDVTRLLEHLNKDIYQLTEADVEQFLDMCDYVWADESINMKHATLLQTGILYDKLSDSKIEECYELLKAGEIEEALKVAGEENVDTEYAKHCGTIVVGVSDAHIRKLLRDPNVRMVIPYHKSGLNPVIARELRIAVYNDYTPVQNTGAIRKGTKSRSNLTSEEIKKAYGLKDFAFYDWFGKTIDGKVYDGKATADKYLEWCEKGYYDESVGDYVYYTTKEKGYILASELHKKLTVEPKFNSFIGEENYYKLLEDFDCYNTITGEHSAQGAVDFLRNGLPSDYKTILMDALKAEQKVQDDFRDHLDNKGLKEEIMEIAKPKDAPKTIEGVKRQLKSTNASFSQEFADNTLDSFGITEVGDYVHVQRQVFATLLDEGFFTNSEERSRTDINAESGMAIVTNKDGIAETFSLNNFIRLGKFKKIAKLATIRNLPDIIKNGHVVADNVNNKYDSADNNKKFAYIECPTELDGKEVIVKLAIKKSPQKNKFWVHSIYTIENVSDSSASTNNGTEADHITADNGDIITQEPPIVKRQLKKTSDTDYLNAVHRGDMETAQRMVDEAAKEAGYTIAAYHGTRNKFTVFDRNRSGNNYKGWLKFGKGFYFAKTDESAGRWASNAKGIGDKITMPVYLRMDNPFIFNSNEYLTIEARVGKMEKLADFVQKEGYDGIIALGSEQYVVFDSEQVKSADPVTYDENGNVIPLSERFNSKNDDIRYQKKTASTRSILANALETTAQNDIERTKLDQYKSKIELIEKEQAKLTELRAKIKELSFAKGAKDTKAIKALQFEANQIANRINVYDRQLLNLESTTALKNVLQREKKLAYDKAKKEGKEALAKYREKAAQTQRELMNRHTESRKKAIERADKTTMRRKIRKLVKELNSLLKNGNKQKNIKEEQKTTVTTALALAEVLFNDDITNEDIVRLGVDSVTEEESILLNEYRDLLDSRDALIAKIESTYGNGIVKENLLTEVGSIEEDLAKVKNRISTLNGKLSEVFVRERARLNKATMNTIFDALITEYSNLADSGNDYIKNAYSEVMKTRLETLKKDLDGKIAKDMSIHQLAEVYDTFKAIKHMISTSNKIFREGRAEDLATYVSNTQGEIYESTTEPKDLNVVADAIASVFNEFSWNNLRPVDAFERLGSKTFEKLFWDYINGMGVAAKDVVEAGEVIANAREKYGYSKWNMKLADTAYTTREGLTFKPSLADKLSIYAYSKREGADGNKQAMGHMVDGGFTYDTGRTYKDVEKGKTYVRRKLSTTYRLSEGNIKSIIDSLTQEQKDYVDAILPYLTDMGKKGNEVSMTLYGIELFGEKVYFPLQSSADYLSSTTQELGATQTMSSLANSGFTKQTKPKADNPIVLRGFDDVVLEHIEKMSNYHGLVIPIENLRRVFDNVSRDTEKNSLSTKALIGSRYGVEAQKYFAQLLTDLNGGMSPSGAKSILGKLFSRGKAMSVSANLSVVAQQYFSIIRAMEVLDPKYFVPLLNGEAKKTDMKQYEELKKYAPIAIIKEMNGFDVGSSGRVKDYIGYEGARKDAKYIKKKIDDIAMWGAGKMDELGWVTIWKAVKAEVASEQKLTPGTDEFYKACETRFTEVVTKTQVFDSVASRSGYMRSKYDAVKYATSFMGEPTVVMGRYFVNGINLVRAIKSKDGGKIKEASLHFARAAAVIAISQVLGNLAKSLIYAGRDDEEDEAFLEKWAKNFAEAMVSDLNVFNSLPFTRDIMSIIEGWDVERPDLTLIADAVTSTKNVFDGDITFDDSLNFIGAVGNLFGIPFKNVIREIKSAVNVVDDIFVDDINPTDMGGAFVEGLTGEERTKQNNLYNAIIRGDTSKIEAIKGTYKTDTAYESAVKSALRENDSRIKEAAKANSSGDIRSFTKYIDTIVAEGHFDRETIEGAIRAEQSAFNTKINKAAEAKNNGDDAEYKKIVRELRDSYRGIYSQDEIVNLITKAQKEQLETKDDDVDEVTSIYKASDVNSAFESGDTEMALEVIDDLINTKVANGMTKKEAQSSIRSSMTSYWKPLYKAAYKSGNTAEKERIERILKASGLYGSASEVIKTCREWRTERD